jgi:hypothetical protein
MNDTMPPIFTADNLALFWHYVKMLIGWVQPFIMIAVGLYLVWALIEVILNMFIKDKPRDDEDDFDYDEY